MSELELHCTAHCSRRAADLARKAKSQHLANRAFDRTTKFVLTPALLLVSAMALTPRPASAAALTTAWDPAIRDAIDVYICEASFAASIPALGSDLTRLRNATRQALDHWNTYGNADFNFILQGGAPPGVNDCAAGSGSFPSGNYTVIRAEVSSFGTGTGCGARAFGGGQQDGSGDRVRGRVVFFRNDCNVPSVPRTTWSYDSTQHADGPPDTRDYNQILLHELGHVLGFPDVAGAGVTVMNGNTGSGPTFVTYQKVLWPDDLADLTDTSNMWFYNRVTTRPIQHERSVDDGLTWTPESWGTAINTNNRIGVAGNDSGTYVVAYADTTASRTLRVFTSNGSSAPANHQSLGTPVLGGVAVAHGFIGGTSTFVLAVVENTDLRWIRYFVSVNDGVSWTNRGQLSFRYLTTDAPTTYGSKYEPALAFNTHDDAFVIAFTEWAPTFGVPVQGQVVTCAHSNPAGANWQGCTRTGFFSNGPPAVACEWSGSDSCILRWTDNALVSGYRMISSQARVDGGPVRLTLTGATNTQNDSTNLAPALTQGNGYFMAAWTGTDFNRFGNINRMTNAGWPTWTNKVFPESLLLSSPTLAFEDHWTEFAFYFVRR